MTHNLYTDPQSGQISMMFVGDPPWHKLGKRLNNPPTSEEAIRAAGLDWQVSTYPLEVKMQSGDYRIVQGQRVIMRTDLWEQGVGECFGVVGSAYEPLQNREAFAFFDDIVGQKAAIYESAGALGNGERIWILARLPETIRVVRDDVCNQYLLLSNSHDGKSSVQVKFTPIRVVCQNTLTMALSRGPSVRVAHTSNIRERMSHVEQQLGIIRATFSSIEEKFQQMAAVQLDKKRLEIFLTALFPDPKNPRDEKAAKRAQQSRKSAEYYFQYGQGNQQQGSAGTLWAAYNGVVEMTDYSPPRHGLHKHLNSIWFGDGYLLKARAFQVAVESLKAWAV